MIERHFRMLRARDELGEAEEQAIRASVEQIVDLPAKRVFIRRGEELNHSCLMLDGLAGRFKDLRNGERQITELHVPGDFADLHSFTLKRLDHNIVTFVPTRIALIPHDKLREITERFPHLTRIYWFSTNLDAAVHREWEVSLGRRNAIARTANLFCELFMRLEIVGLTEGRGYRLDLTQTDLAECLGLTAVHVNRTLKELRERGLVEFRAGRVEIIDFDGLKKIAEFDPAYLYLERRPR